jgi:hypothetical protein
VALFRAISLVGLLVLGGTQALAIDISDHRESTKDRKSLEVTTSDVVLILIPSHGKAVVQFTEFSTSTASYRWRYRPSSSQKVLSGAGQVVESYDRKLMPDGSYRVSPKTDHNPVVKAGDINFEWSAGGKSRGWLYYNSDRASVQVLPADAFDRDL